MTDSEAAELNNGISRVVTSSGGTSNENSRESSDEPFIMNKIQDRASLNDTLNKMLFAVLCLLGVSIVVAFIGVANTTILSVIERRREFGLTRALGLTRGQLLTSLCIESLTTALVAVVLGLLLGSLFGWAAVSTIALESNNYPLRTVLPWGQLFIILIVALSASLVATFIPARRAARQSPIDALSIT